MFSYVPGYQSSTFKRFLYSLFVQTPAQVWFRWLTAFWPSSVQFVNHTSAPESSLASQWATAQQNIGKNSWPSSIGGPMHGPDARALTVQPKHVTVVAVPDVPVAVLAIADSNAAWLKDKDPSGTILIVGNNGFMGYETVHSFACPWRKPRVYAAASLVNVTLEYEFENIILAELGYSVEGR